eukprot:3922643-Rhodomonas_salina.4
MEGHGVADGMRSKKRKEKREKRGGRSSIDKCARVVLDCRIWFQGAQRPGVRGSVAGDGDLAATARSEDPLGRFISNRLHPPVVLGDGPAALNPPPSHPTPSVLLSRSLASPHHTAC